MTNTCFTPFISVIDSSIIPSFLNNPYDSEIPAICKVAVGELEDFLLENQSHWKHNFGLDPQNQTSAKGKMFGVLVVRNSNCELGYLSTFSGKVVDEPHHPRFVPSLFDISINDFFINKGMAELTAMGYHIKLLDDSVEIEMLKEIRRTKSVELQQQLFDHYHFLNEKLESKSLCSIFEDLIHKKPPAGAGECATPKLLQYAFNHQMKPLAVAEFWWGKASKSGDRQHKQFYPPCRDKCYPILRYMLDNVSGVY